MNDNIDLVCKRIIVTQGLSDGFLSGPLEITLSLGQGITAKISQLGERLIEISSDTEINCDRLFEKFQTLEKLLMLIDGVFYPIKSLTYEESGISDSNLLYERADENLKSRLAYYESRDFCCYHFLQLLTFKDVLDDKIYKRWEELLDQLNIAFQVLLYSLSNNRNPVDMNFAFIVELAEPFVELIKENTYYCQTLSPGQRDTSLKMCVDNIITCFGKMIFAKELNGNYKDFLDKIVGSRIRVMHIKKNQEKYFNRKECIRYSMKFSLLYRCILFELLNISSSNYEFSLQNAVNEIDNW